MTHSPRRLLRLAAALSLLAAPAALGQVFATPGKDGPAGVLAGVVNTYYPGAASVVAGATSITLGASAGAATTITAGDLLLVIQMQDADIDAANGPTYGDGATGRGYTAINSTGLYEYVVANGAVAAGGGALALIGAGAGGGTLNAYDSAAATAAAGQRTFQVIRVPQYTSATLGSTLTAAAWNGATGGVLAIDVRDDLALGNATVSVDALGFRGGGSQQLMGGTGANSDYVTLSSDNVNGNKGEGIAGTPKFVWSPNGPTGALVNTGVEGYPNGSRARGAPGNAGGGGTDASPTANTENTGGGGGGNWGQGGTGGRSWSTGVTAGGLGGSTVAQASSTRLVMGGGGGQGAANNGHPPADESAGGSGGGIVMIRSGNVTGTGLITANGGTPGNDTANDGGGGGGAGGSIVLTATTGNWANCTVRVNGGRGSDAWDTEAPNGTPPPGPNPPGSNPTPNNNVWYHGPGGGGGGGIILLSGTQVAATEISGGEYGLTTTAADPYGVQPGEDGIVVMGVTPTEIPGAQSGSQGNTGGQDSSLDTNFLAFTTPPQAVAANTVSGTLTIQAQTPGGAPLILGAATALTLTSTSAGATFQPGATVTIPAGQSSVSFTFKDTNTGVPVITATAPVAADLNPTSQPQQVFGAVKSLLITAPSATVAGTAFQTTVFALDTHGQVNPTYVGKVTLTSSDGAAVLPGSYTFLAADNGVHTFTTTLNTVATLPTITQSLTAADNLGSTHGVADVIVYVPPAITSANSATFTDGTAGTFTITTIGNPIPALSESGTLPAGFSLEDIGNGTGTLVYSGTFGPIEGVYVITLIASDGEFTATQTFTLTILCATTTCPAGDTCGTLPDGCGGTLSCSPGCTAPETCGGAGVANHCGCTPLASCPAGDNCGTVSDGCGGMVICNPGCTVPQTCGGAGVANQCGCTPLASCPIPDNCGTVADGCGGDVSCSPGCSAPESCGGSGVANLCGCTPITSCPSPENCGSVSDTCGALLSCGSCLVGSATPRCSASNICVQCLANGDCGGLTPVCNASNACVACSSDTDCSGTTPACEPSGACGQCSASNQSQCVVPNATCDFATGTCVGCTSDSDCSGSDPVCDLPTNTCVPCSSTEQCPAIDGGSACVLSGIKLGDCVDCVANSDCPAPLICDTTSNQCVPNATSTTSTSSASSGSGGIASSTSGSASATTSGAGSGGTTAAGTSGSASGFSSTVSSTGSSNGSSTSNSNGTATSSQTASGATSGSTTQGSTSGTSGSTSGSSASATNGSGSAVSTQMTSGATSGSTASGTSGTGSATSTQMTSGGTSGTTATIGTTGTIGSGANGSATNGSGSSGSATNGSAANGSGAGSGSNSGGELSTLGGGGCNCTSAGTDSFAWLAALAALRLRRPRRTARAS